jgi:bifunctional isochorismate lyase/aryl carrier protein
VIANIARLRAACLTAGIPVIYTAQPAEQSPHERGLLTDVWGPGLTACPDAQQIVEPLRPSDRDIVLTKYRYSAFHGTELLALLRARGRDQLFICGVYAHIGVLLTACDAFMHDVQPFLLCDAVADFSRAYHELALGYAAERCAVTLSSDALLSAIGAGDHQAAVRAHVAAVLECEPSSLREDDALADVGVDSIRMMALVERLRAEGASLSFVDLAECATLRDVGALLTRGRA